MNSRSKTALSRVTSKPLFKNLDVYDPAQDKDKGVMKKMYEGLIGGLSDLLKNSPREEVATKADVSGPVENPRASTWGSRRETDSERVL